VHITGSDKTHDLIVWGPPGPERAERMARNKPLLEKDITSELGNVSPVIVVPGVWNDKALNFQADAIAGAVTNNASFNCNAAKMLITPKGWSQTAQLQQLIMEKAAAAPARNAWYPGAAQRYQFLTEGREVVTSGKAAEGQLPWTMVKGIDAGNPEDKALNTEPFCSIISATELGNPDDPAAFLEEAVKFANERLWGTLSASLVVPDSVMKDPKGKEAVEWAIAKLRYGAVGVNVWPAAVFGIGTTPWGAYPGSTLTNIQSGRGFVHNTMMIENIEKCVLRHPVVASPKPPILATHKSANVLGRRVTYFEEAPGFLGLPMIIAAALRG
jgi:aldehyde dehydrogenase (NAD(P)+)